MTLAWLHRNRLRLWAETRSRAGRLRAVYFLYFAASGTSLPYLAAYLRGRGFRGSEIGSIQMLPSLLAPFVAMGWAHLADRRGDPVEVLRWITAWAAFSALFLPFAATPFAVGAVVFSVSLGDRALVALLDSVSLEHCRSHPATSYARLRMFGSIGFFVLALVLGFVLTLRGDRPGDEVVPVVIAACTVGYALAARRLPRTAAPHAYRPRPRELPLDLLRDPRLLVLFAACAVHWAACVPYSLLLGVYVRDLGLPAQVTGAGITFAVTAEIAVMMAYPFLARRRSARSLLAVSFLASAVRWGLLSQATRPVPIAALQALHGLTYGLFWSTLVELVGAQVPPQLRATGLALCQALVFGVGTAVGAKLGGLGYDHYGSVAPLFLWAAGADLLLALGVVGLLAQRRLRGEAPPPADPA